MAFEFQNASCVVIGTFNIYILHPRWLATHNVIEKGVEAIIEMNFTEPGFRFRFEKHDATWLVAPNRLAVESRRPTTDCGSFVAKVLTALPETPLFAIGTNAVYHAPMAELDSLSAAIRGFPRTESPRQGETVERRTFHAEIKHAEHETTNLQLAITGKGLELGCNTHTELRDRVDATPAAVAAAESFFAHRARALALVQHFFGATMEDDAGNP